MAAISEALAPQVVRPLEGVKVCMLSTIPIRTSRIINRECQALVRSGAAVTLISPNPAEGSDGKFTMRHFRCLKGALGRLVSSPMILSRALGERADVYHVHTFQLVPIAVLLKALFRKRVLYDMFEDFPSMVLTREWRPRWLCRVVSRTVHTVEDRACRRLDAVITADPAVLRQYIHREQSADQPRRVVFYNFPSLDVFFQEATLWNVHGAKQYDVVYSGGMSERTGVFVLLDAIEKLVERGRRPRVLMFGYTDTAGFKAQFLERARKKGIEDCFELLGRVPHEQVPLLLMQARVGVVPLQAIPKFLKNIPTKVFEYWACGLPIVASNLPPIRLFFREGVYGHMVDPRSSEQFANAIGQLLENQAKAERMGEQARHAVLTRFNALPEQRKLVRLYSQLLSRGVEARAR